MKILVVEDNPISRKLTRVALETEGYHVVEAADGQSAIDSVGRGLPDLVLQDIILPDIDGFELVRRLKAIPGADAIPVLALSGLISRGDEKKLPEAPFADYLFKPVETSFLINTVRAHLAASQTPNNMPGWGRVVLAVDDDPSQLKLLATYLANLGFGVTSARDGVEALAKAEVVYPDAVISDVLMPRLDGFELCLALRKRASLCKIPVVLLTNNYSDEADRRLAVDSGASALVMRTPDCKEAVDALLACLDRPAPAPAHDSSQFETGHRESLIRQLERQTKLNIDLGRRCAAQSAQISVLASAAQYFMRPEQNIESLLSEILAHYLAVTGFSRGAVYLLDANSQFKLSWQIGFSQANIEALADFFGHIDLLRDAMSSAEPIAFTAPAKEASIQALLTRASLRTVLIAPLIFDRRSFGVIALFSDARELDQEWLNFSKVVNGQIGQAVALWQSISQLKYLADYDTLTGLPNRSHLSGRLQHLLRAEVPAEAVLLRVNIDRFEEINNALSYQNGDELLRQFGKRLKEAVGRAEIIARLDSDEFGVVVSGNRVAQTAADVALSIIKAVDAPFIIDHLTLDVHASIGVAIAPDHATSAEDLLRRADMAMRAAKRSAAGYMLYTDSIDRYDPKRLTLMGELSDAIEHDELSLYYQPKVNLKTQRTVGVEALLRWHHPLRGLITPDQFIPLAEKTGAIHRLTQWVLKTAIRQSAEWQRIGIFIRIAINLSTRNLLEPAFPDRLLAFLQNGGISADCLTMEITESALMEEPAKAHQALIMLSEHGIRFSIDDFGTGYSSLAYLKHLPVSEIKIDKVFVSTLLTDPDNEIIVRSTIDLGHNLGLSVIAEGVEDQQTLVKLGELGCDEVQGYFLSRPLPAEEFQRWLEESPWG